MVSIFYCGLSELFDDLNTIIDVRLQKIQAVKVFLIIYKYKQHILYKLTLLKNFEKNLQNKLMIYHISKTNKY